MEILNNIWNALSTENELFIKLNGIPCSFIEVYLIFKLFTTLLKTNYSKKQLYVYVLSVSIVSIFCNFFLPEPFNVFINYAFIFILLLKYFKFNILQSIVAMVVPFAIFGLVSSLILNPFLKIFNTTYEVVFITPIYRIAYLFITYFTVALIIFI